MGLCLCNLIHFIIVLLCLYLVERALVKSILSVLSERTCRNAIFVLTFTLAIIIVLGIVANAATNWDDTTSKIIFFSVLGSVFFLFLLVSLWNCLTCPHEYEGLEPGGYRM